MTVNAKQRYLKSLCGFIGGPILSAIGNSLINNLDLKLTIGWIILFSGITIMIVSGGIAISTWIDDNP